MDDLGTFDRIVMNPPFHNADDIQHIQHARTFLAPGGMLVAICAAGSGQRDAFESSADDWIDLPAGSFKEAGTGVNAAIVVFSAETLEPHQADNPHCTCSDCTANHDAGRS